MVTAATPVACPVCHHAGWDEVLRKEGNTIWRCHSCGLQHSRTEPAEDTLALLYGREYFTAGGSGYRDYAADALAHRAHAKTYLKRLARLEPPGRLLEIGCATGFFLDEARRSGWEVTGCDVSPYAADEARARGLDIRTAAFLDADWGHVQFDLVVLLNVLEHIPRPRMVERRLADLVRGGGLLLVETWDCDSLIARILGSRWHQYDPEYVPNYYSKRSLGQLFDQPDWDLLEWRRTAKAISLRRGLEILADRMAGGRTRSWFLRLANTKTGNLIIPYVTGDLVYAVYRRTLPTEGEA